MAIRIVFGRWGHAKRVLPTKIVIDVPAEMKKRSGINHARHRLRVPAVFPKYICSKNTSRVVHDWCETVRDTVMKSWLAFTSMLTPASTNFKNSAFFSAAGMEEE